MDKDPVLGGLSVSKSVWLLGITHRTDASLTASSEFAGNDAGNSKVQIRVIEDDEARVIWSTTDPH